MICNISLLGHCRICDLVLWTVFCTSLAVGGHGLWCSLSFLVYWTSPWRRKWQPTPVVLPGKSHGQRSLANYSSWGHKESDTIEWLNTLSLCCLFASILHLQVPLSPHFISASVAHSSPTLCDPMDYIPPGSLVHRILLARTPAWVPISLSRGSPQPRDWTWVSCITGRFFTVWATSSVQSLSCVRLFVTPWTTAHQASLSITNSWSLPKPMSIELVMPSNHLILRHPLLLLPSIFPRIRVFSSESALCMRWPKY